MIKIYTPLKRLVKLVSARKAFVLILCFCTFLSPEQSFAQTVTSWKGTNSNGWLTAGNWTNGVPTSTSDVIIGDAAFTGTNNPVFNSNVTINSLTLGGTKAASLSLLDNKTIFKVTGNVTIAANGTLNNTASALYVGGNWSNAGSYVVASEKLGNKTYNAAVILNGTTQNISGATTFMDLVVNQGSTTTLSSAITVTRNFSVSGKLDPATYLITLTGAAFTIGTTGTIKVKATNFAGNYSIPPATINTGSTVEFAAADRTQTIAAFSNGKAYSSLLVSGGTTKTLTGNISFSAASISDGKLLISNGTLDLGVYTANRGTANAGGIISISNGATLKIGGTNTFPANFTTHTIGTTSTVEYSGNNQVVTSEAYGNLTLSSGSSAAVKTMPVVAFTTAGNLTASVGTGTSVSFTANQNITVNGNLILGASTTFNGGAFTHTLDGDWINEGAFTANTSTVVLRGTGKVISGAAQTVFNNLTITGSIRGKATNITVAGNLATTGAGTIIHAAEVSGVAASGTLTMSGAGKTISGMDITFDNLVIAGTVSSANDLTLTGSLNVPNTATNALNLTGGTVLFSGTGKTISAASATSLNFNALRVTGTVTTGSSFSLKSDFSGSGNLTATAGTISFTGASAYAGAHKLFNVNLNGTRLQLAANASLGIASTFTIAAGTFDVTTSAPNTVELNGSDQNITGTTYHTLILAGTGTKTGLSNFTTSGNLQINSGVKFKAGNFTYTVKGNWLNNGIFTADSSTIIFSGADDAQLTGSTAFSAITINKSTSGNTVNLKNDVTAATVNMTTGKINTGSNVITITGSRTGTGIILGTITRSHAFNAGVPYTFESPFNTLTFGTVTGITSVTVTVKIGDVSGFPFGGAINRVYAVSIPNGTYSGAALRLHYDEEELNGNTEAEMNLWEYGTAWVIAGKSAYSSTDNWVEKSGLTSLNGQWTLSGDNMVMQWTGATNSNWHNPANWSAIEGTTVARVPLATDIVDIGGTTIINQPVIASDASVKSIQFDHINNASLTLSGGNLTVAGNLNGAWSGNATHTLAVGNQSITIGGDLGLSDGTAGHAINLSIGSGSVIVAQSLMQAGNANITFSGSGNLKIGQDFLYANGNFSSGTGTITYFGGGNQLVAGNISYNNLIINKSGGSATLEAPTAINGNLSLTTGGSFLTNGNLTIAGNVLIEAGTTFNGGGNIHTVNGNWINNGTFLPTSGTVKFTGNGNQSINATTFNYLTINKTGGEVTLTGNLVLNANLAVEAGALNLGVYTLTRSAVGGNTTFGPNTALYLSGANNYPTNFNAHYLDNTSTVYYNGSGTQNVARISYGHLVLQDGNSNAKTLTGSTTVKGNLIINNGATLDSDSYTLTAQGNVENNGTFNPGTGTVILAGVTKKTDGALIFNDLTITGSYTLNSGSYTINNNFYNSGSIEAGTNAATFSGNVTNAGSMSSNGSTTFSGLKQQTIQLIGAFTSTASGITYFNGNVAPILNSNSSPTYVSVIINNTAGITASADWTVYGLFKVSAGAAFHGRSSTHHFNGQFVNEGTVTSAGTLDFIPAVAQTLSLGSDLNSSGTVRFGGSGQINFASSPANLKNIEIANTHGAGITPPLGWNIAGDLIIKSGSLLNAGTGLNHTLKGNFTNDGVLIGNTSTFTFDPSASVIRGMGITDFYNVIINDSTTFEADINIKGNLTTNGIVIINNNTVNFNGITEQLINGTAEISFYDLLITNSAGRVQPATNLNVINTLTIEAGGVLKPGPDVVINNDGPEGALLGSGTIEVTRTLAPSDYIDQYKFNTYDLSVLTVKFSGTAAQSSSLTSFYNLTINNPAGFTLSGPTAVTGTLRLENSNITANGHVLTVGTSVAAPGSVEVAGTGMVLGKLKRWIPATAGSVIQFPVGTGNTRRTAFIQYTTAPSGGTLTAEFVLTGPGIRGLPLTDLNSNQEGFVVNNVGTSGYWTIMAGTTGAETLTGGVYNATFEATNFAGVSKLENLVVLKRDNSTQPWNLYGSYVTAAGSLTSPVISRIGLSGFSDFALGGNEISTLPVTITALKAVTQGSNAVITWKTAIEINNHGFYVEVSADGKLYRPLGFVQSKDANARTVQNYHFTDTENGKWGTRYYRLKQVDLNGDATYYGPKVVTFKQEINWLAVYPNPFTQSLEILIESEINQAGKITLHTINGKQIWSTEKHLLQGKNSLNLALPENLVKGFYYLQVQLAQTSKSIKLVKE